MSFDGVRGVVDLLGDRCSLLARQNSLQHKNRCVLGSTLASSGFKERALKLRGTSSSVHCQLTWDIFAGPAQVSSAGGKILVQW